MPHPSPRDDQEPSLPLTPMIDVMFLLLIFFMCSLSFQTLEGRLAAFLPEVDGYGGNGPIEKIEVRMDVVEEGRRMDPFEPGKPWSGQPGTRFVYDDSRVIEYSIGPKKTRDLGALQDRLDQLLRASRRAGLERPATIDARKGIVYDDVIQVMDAAKTVGYREVTFVGSYE